MFNVSDTVGAEIMEISWANFRNRLERARRDLHSFMDEKCGLVNEQNSCRCTKKTNGFIEMGYVDQNNLSFAIGHLKQIKDVPQERSRKMEDITDQVVSKIFGEHHFLDPTDPKQSFNRLLDQSGFRKIFEVLPSAEAHPCA